MQNTEYIGKLLFAKVAGGITEKEFKDEFEKTAANPLSWGKFFNGLGMKGANWATGGNKGDWMKNMTTAWNNTSGFMNKANLLGNVGWHWAKRNKGALALGAAGLYAGNRLLNGGGGGYGYR